MSLICIGSIGFAQDADVETELNAAEGPPIVGSEGALKKTDNGQAPKIIENPKPLGELKSADSVEPSQGLLPEPPEATKQTLKQSPKESSKKSPATPSSIPAPDISGDDQETSDKQITEDLSKHADEEAEDEKGPKTSLSSTEDETETKEGENKVCHCRYEKGTPYRDRRPPITGIFGVQVGTYEPKNYIPQAVANQTYDAFYGGSHAPNVELVFGAKYNTIIGSIGAQLTGGAFSASNVGTGASLSIYPITFGGVFALDTIFKEPYVVPYAEAGGYVAFFDEKGGGEDLNGRSTPSGFYGFGLMFQLDWIDPETHDSGYDDFGFQNTFLYVEARSFLANNDPGTDFSTPLQISGGFKIEF